MGKHRVRTTRASNCTWRLGTGKRAGDGEYRLERRCMDNAGQLSKTPAQTVRRLQGEVAALENRLIEQQATVLATARKSEITLRSELDVCRHEVATLQRTLEAKDREVRRYQAELEAIIAELMALRGTS